MSNPNDGHSTVAATLDRIISGSNTTIIEVDSSFVASPEFIPSATWQGSKQGYYFGTAKHGTGYYKDPKQQPPTSATGGNDITSAASNGQPVKKSVRIAEDNNEIKILLEQLEEKNKDAVVVELSARGIRAAAKSLQSIYQKNVQQRATFADEPQKYMDSEVQLYEHLTGLQAVGADPTLYEHVAGSQLLSTLIQLLEHDNADVCASVVSLFLEWIDPSLVEEDFEVLSILKGFAKQVLEAWESVLYNLLRFQQENLQDNDDDEDDAEQDANNNSNNLKGVENTLSLMENLMELDTLTTPDGGLLGEDQPSAAGYMVRESKGKIVSWLYSQLESESAKEALQGRCLEILAFLSQNEDVYESLPNWASLPPITPTSLEDEPRSKKQKPSDINGIEDLIQILARYRKKQPGNEVEIEMLENAGIALSSCISFSKDNMSAFLDAQGVQLVIRCLKERVMAGGVGLKLLDFFGDDPVFKRGAEDIVTASGLKYIFPLLLASRIPKPSTIGIVSKKEKREWLGMIKKQTIRVFYALTLQLDDQSPEEAKARFLAKFIEDDLKHCDRLVELLLEYDERARKAEYNFYRSSEVEEETMTEEQVALAAFDAKLKGGGDIYHRVAAITAYVCTNSKRCHERVLSQLNMQQSGISLLKTALTEFASSLKSGGRQKQHVDHLLDSI
ncbi:catenin-beta-like, Arm-motif containing nuclear-domain containing protein [Nitzschia inconspicua]|uniref:Catenin-beta-like, Arm-motif containing nuclear-domain containing protein n=1 Tax=Nitzschia inconspicua TaxID=303405 RepID=A0A9K3KC43_9STRA|nr:catenin-beta-like, Arm-motif containing nuclear-domain containing protein [Nitzschia inconspicua]